MFSKMRLLKCEVYFYINSMCPSTSLALVDECIGIVLL